MNTTSPSIFVKHGNDELVKAFQKYDVSFLVIGGTAVFVHGCRNRFDVDDFDVLIDPTINNANKTIDALNSAHLGVPFKAERLAKPSVQLPVKIMQYWADLLTPDEGVDFLQLLDRSVVAQIGNMSVRVIGLIDLIEMKELTVSKLGSDKEKHEKDLQCLKSKFSQR